MVSLNKKTGSAMRNRTLTSKSIRKELRRVGPMANPSAAASRAIGAQAMHTEERATSPSRRFPSRTRPNFSSRRYIGPAVKRGNSEKLMFLSSDGRVLVGKSCIRSYSNGRRSWAEGSVLVCSTRSREADERAACEELCKAGFDKYRPSVDVVPFPIAL